MRDEEIFSAGSAELKEIQRRRLALQFGSHLGGIIELCPNQYLALVLHRSAEDDRPMDEELGALVGNLLPHLRQTMRLSDELAAATLKSDLLTDVGDILSVGLVLCDSGGRIIWANATARSTLDKSPTLGQSQGHVRAMQPADGIAFRALLSRAAEDAMSHPLQMTLGRANPETAVQVMVVGAHTATQGDLSSRSPTLMLLMCEPGQPLNVSTASVAELFSMSAAEARLTASLCDGLSLADYARQRGISEGTARIQLKRAMAKTESPRQAELVRRVCASLAVSMTRKSAQVLERPASLSTAKPGA
jgi:DNA-binding CsgD family transcriptional regulator